MNGTVLFQISTMADAAEVVDINTASVKYLETLFGVGKAKAEAIHTIRMVRKCYKSKINPLVFYLIANDFDFNVSSCKLFLTAF